MTDIRELAQIQSAYQPFTQQFAVVSPIIVLMSKAEKRAAETTSYPASCSSSHLKPRVSSA
jgi:hypothetical protein